MPHIRPFHDGDSVNDLTALLHRAYARLGATGLNYTAVDQTAAVTAERIRGGHCFVASADGALIGMIVVQPIDADNACEYFTRQGVAAVHQFAVDPRPAGQRHRPGAAAGRRTVGRAKRLRRTGDGHG